MDIHLAYINELLSEQEMILEDSNIGYKDKLFDLV